MRHENRMIALEGALNVRELGGLPLKGGRTVRNGKLIRAGRLSKLTEQDRDILFRQWNVTTVVDLRNDQEISEHPDILPETSRFLQISMISGEAKGISREDFGMSILDRAIMRAKDLYENGGSGKLLRGMYGQMAEDRHCMERIREFFDALEAQGDGSFLWHCTSGKDRTGVTGALLLYTLGAEMETILEDYLFTNEQNHRYRENLLDQMRIHGAAAELVEEMRVLESVDSSYMENFFHAIEDAYGSVDRFLTEEIGLTEEKRRNLIDRYTEQPGFEET